MSRLLAPVVTLVFGSTAPAVPVADLPPGALARSGGTAFRHPDRPTALSFSADGARLASGGTDGTLRVWDVATGAELHRVAVADSPAVVAAFSADGTLLAAAFGDRKVRLFDARTYRPLRTLPSPDLDALCLTRDGGLVGGVGRYGELPVIEAGSGLERIELPPGNALALAADGRRAAATDEKDKDRVTVYELPGGKPLLTVRHGSDNDPLTGVALSPDGSKLAAGGERAAGRVKVWDVQSGKLLGDWPGQAPVAFRSADQVVALRAGRVVVWELGKADPVREIDAGAYLFAVSPDGRRLATAGGGTRIRIWDLTTGSEQLLPGDEPTEVRDLAPDGGDGLLVSTTRGLRTWSPMGKPAERPVLAGDHGAAVAAGDWLIAASGARVGVWDGYAPGRPLPAEPTRLVIGVGGRLRTAGASIDGTRVALLTGDRTLTVADPATGRVLRTWEAPAAVMSAALAPEGSRLTAVTRPGSVRCWDLTGAGSGPPAEAWSARVAAGPHGAVVYPAADGRLVAVASPVRVTLFDAASGSRIDGFMRRLTDGPFRSVALSPDGALVAAGFEGAAGSVAVWETTTRSVVRRFASGTGTVRHLVFRDGGRTLVSAGGDDTLIAWDLSGRSGRPAPTADNLRAAWDLLDRDDPAVGYPPVWTLAAGGADGLAAIRAGLARSGETEARVKRLIAELDAPSFRDRERAGEELMALGSHALPALIAAAESHPSAESRRRAEGALAVLKEANVVIPPHGLFGEPLRRVRAVAALEAIGGPEAVRLLDEIKGAGGRPSEEAERALKRAAAR